MIPKKTSQCQNCKVAMVVDLYEDRHKSRFAFPLVMLVLFLYVVFTIFSSTPEEERLPETIAIGIEPLNTQLIGGNNTNQRTARIYVVDKREDPVTNATLIYVSIESIYSIPYSEWPNCNTIQRTKFRGTYLDLRSDSICIASTKGDSNYTDKFGKVEFSEFSIPYGPEGYYQLKYKTGNVSSGVMIVNFITNVDEIKVDPKSAVATATLGVKLHELKVQLTTSNGTFASNQRVVITSFQNSSYHENEAVEYKASLSQFAIILNDEADHLTDENGVATFSNVTIVATSTKYVYLYFVVNDVITAPLTSVTNFEKPYLPQPIVITGKGTTVSIMNVLDTEIFEGDTFVNQPKLRLLDSSGKGVPGLGGMAFIKSVGSRNLLDYTQYLNKEFIRPICANYNTSVNSIYQKVIKQIYLTDSNGDIAYDTLGISKFGNLPGGFQNVIVYFIVGDVKSTEVMVKVKSTVASVILQEFNIDNFPRVRFKLRVLDSAGKGVFGKHPEQIKYLNYATNVETKSLTMILANPDTTYSDEDGYLNVEYDQTIKVAPTGYYSITLDGITVISEKATFGDTSAYNLAYLTTEFLALNVNDNFSLTVNQNNLTDINFSTSGVVMEFVQLYPSINVVQQSLNITNKLAPTINLKLVEGYNGTYPLSFNIKKGTSILSKVNCSLSVTNPVVDATVTSSFDNYQKLSMGTSSSFTIQVFMQGGVPYANKNIYIRAIVYGCSYIYNDKYVNKTLDPNVVITLSSTNPTTDSNGIAYLTFTPASGYIGKWNIGFKVYGIDAVGTIKYTTNFPVSSVSIVQEPNAVSASYPDGYPVSWKFTTNAKVKVLDLNNNPIGGYLVVAILVPYTASDLGSLDILSNSSMGVDNPLAFTCAGHKCAVSNNITGIAEFTMLQMVDVNGSGCFYMNFVVGTDSTMYVSKQSTAKLCFKNYNKLVIKPSSSREIPICIRPDQPSGVYLKVPNDKDLLNIYGYFTMISSIHNLNSFEIPNNLSSRYSNIYLKNNRCYYYGGSMYGGCGTNELNMQRNSEFSAEAQMLFTYAQQIWKKPSMSEKVRFSYYTPLSGDNREVSTQMKVGSIPFTIEIIIQPPTDIVVDQIFQVVLRVQATKFGRYDVPLPHVPITAYMSSKKITTISKSKIDDAIAMMGDINIDQEDVVNAIEGTKPSIEESRKIAYSDVHGNVSFNIRIVAGKPDIYSLIFKCSTVSSEQTQQFSFTHLISRVVFAKSLNQTIEGSFGASGEFHDNEVPLNINPVISVIDAQGNKIAGLEQQFELKVVNRTALLVAMNVTTFNESEIYISTVDYKQKSYVDQTPNEKLSTLFKLIAAGSQSMASVLPTTIQPKVIYDTPKMNAAGDYEFSNVILRVPMPADYYLIIYAQGLESHLSNIITVNNSDDHQTTSLNTILEILTLILFIACTVIFNITKVPVYCVLLVFASIGGEIYFARISNDKGNEYKIAVPVIMGFVFLVHMAEVIQFFRGRAHATHHEVVRLRVFREYTYKNFFPLEYSCTNTTANTKILPVVKDQSIDESYSKELLNKEPSKKRYTCKERVQYAKVFIKKLFTPFGIGDYGSGDAFYFPQRIIVAIIIGVLGFIYFSITLLVWINSLMDQIEGLQESAEKAIISFLTAAIDKARIVLNYDFSNTDIQPVLEILNEAIGYLKSLERSVYISFQIANAFALTIFSVSFICMIVNFKQEILKARKGQSRIQERTVEIGDAGEFSGNVISNSLMGYCIICVVMTILMIPLCFKLFWQLLWDYRITLAVLIVPQVVKLITDPIASRTIYGKNFTIKYRLLVQIYEFIWFFFCILSGAVTSVYRFLIGLLSVVASTARIDYPMYPDWILNIYYIDYTNASYLSLIKSYHIFNNPVHITFTYKLLEYREDAKKKLTLTADEKVDDQITVRNTRYTRNKMWLCLIVLCNKDHKTGNNPFKDDRKNVKAEIGKTSKANILSYK